MSITLHEALQSLTVPELKDLICHVPQASTVGRKDELIERITSAMLGAGLKPIWSQLDAMQSAAVAEAAHHPQGEHSPQRFQAKYQSNPAFEVAADKITAVILFLRNDPTLRFHFLTDLCGIHYPDNDVDHQFAVVYHLDRKSVV